MSSESCSIWEIDTNVNLRLKQYQILCVFSGITPEMEISRFAQVKEDIVTNKPARKQCDTIRILL